MSVQTYNPAVAIAQFISGELKFSIMENFKETNPKEYLRFGVYDMDGKDLLFIAIQGFFASSAWCKGDKEYNAVMGQKFEGITSDDGRSWSLDRANSRRVSNSLIDSSKTPARSSKTLLQNICSNKRASDHTRLLALFNF